MSEPKFIPKAGQVDYTSIRYCPVTNCLVRYKDKLLLVKRSLELRLYPGYWNGISGFLDDNKSVEDKVYEELSEELGLQKSSIVCIKKGSVIIQESEEYQKTWLVFPVLVDVNTDVIKLDWEAEKYQWFNLSEINGLKLLPGFDQVISQLL